MIFWFYFSKKTFFFISFCSNYYYFLLKRCSFFSLFFSSLLFHLYILIFKTKINLHSAKTINIRKIKSLSLKLRIKMSGANDSIRSRRSKPTRPGGSPDNQSNQDYVAIDQTENSRRYHQNLNGYNFPISDYIKISVFLFFFNFGALLNKERNELRSHCRPHSSFECSCCLPQYDHSQLFTI